MYKLYLPSAQVWDNEQPREILPLAWQTGGKVGFAVSCQHPSEEKCPSSSNLKSTLKSCFAIHNPSPLSYPVVFLVGSLLTTALLGLGLVSFHEEHDLTKVERR